MNRLIHQQITGAGEAAAAASVIAPSESRLAVTDWSDDSLTSSQQRLPLSPPNRQGHATVTPLAAR